MLQMRKFDPSTQGFIYLLLCIIVPICPVAITLFFGEIDYLFFVILIVASITLIYDLRKSQGQKACIRISIEDFITIFALAVAVVFSLLGIFVPNDNEIENLPAIFAYIGTIAYSLSIVITLFEIIFCFVLEMIDRKNIQNNVNPKKSLKIVKAGEDV